MPPLEGRAAVIALLSSMLKEAQEDRPAEIELRLGRIVDGAYESGVTHDQFERVVARLRAGVGLVPAGAESGGVAFTHEVHSEGGSIRNTETGHCTRKLRMRQTLFHIVGSSLAVRVCQSAEERVSPPRVRPRCRGNAETAVRAKLRESFVYKQKARYDCTRCVTANVTSGMLTVPRCTYEVEVEAVGAISAESLLLKMEDVVGFLEPSHKGYAVHVG